jgi:hypothetical protein
MYRSSKVGQGLRTDATSSMSAGALLALDPMQGPLRRVSSKLIYHPDFQCRSLDKPNPKL